MEKKPRKTRESKFICLNRVSPKTIKEYRRYKRYTGEDITYKEYIALLDELTTFITQELLEGKMYKLPRQQGYLFIRMRKHKTSAPRISWGLTMKERQKTGDPTAVVLNSPDAPVRKLAWLKVDIKTKNKGVYIFRTATPLKKRITQASLKNKSYIFFDENIKKDKHTKGNPESSDGPGVP